MFFMILMYSSAVFVNGVDAIMDDLGQREGEEKCESGGNFHFLSKSSVSYDTISYRTYYYLSKH
jgi:hypothetical protein